jgi:hypothetical protein
MDFDKAMRVFGDKRVKCFKQCRMPYYRYYDCRRRINPAPGPSSFSCPSSESSWGRYNCSSRSFGLKTREG